MTKKFWLKERHNPQIGIYYVKIGQLSKTAAKKYTKPIYGDNTMLSFDTEAEYLARIAELESKGEKIYEC